MRLQDEFNHILASVAGTYGAYVKHMQKSEEAHINENEPFQLASCFKIPVLVALFKEVHEGTVDLDTRIQLRPEHRRTDSGVLEALEPGVEISLRDVATLMINMSDNVATDRSEERRVGKECR